MGTNDRRPHDPLNGPGITCTGDPASTPPGDRPELLDDLAKLALTLEDLGVYKGDAGHEDTWEAFARVVGALDLTAEEEDWLERQ